MFDNNYTLASLETSNHFMTASSYSLSNEKAIGINIPDAIRVIKMQTTQIISTLNLYVVSLSYDNYT